MVDQSIVLNGITHPLSWRKTGNKDIDGRIKAFTNWQKQINQPWYQPDLESWRDELLARVVRTDSDGKEHTMSHATVRAYLSSVRNAYQQLLVSNEVRNRIWQAVDPSMPLSERDIFVRELYTRIQNAVHPSAASVKVIKKQDIEESKHRRLRPSQADALIAAPGSATMKAIRDTAIIALLLSTGIREDELCNLDVDDLRQELGPELALRIREGKGGKQRLIPYGDLNGCLVLADRWLHHAGIRSGAVFRGLNKAQRVRPGRLTTRSVHLILLTYPIVINGTLEQVRPHDCRRTYARLMYEAGVPLLAIMQNLGHADLETTKGYIGTLDAHQRRPTAFLHFNL